MDDEPQPAPPASRHEPYLQEAVALMAGIVLPGGLFGYAAYRFIKYKRWRMARKRAQAQALENKTPADGGNTPTP